MGHCKCILYVYPIYLCTSIYDTMCTCVSVGVPPLAVYKHGPGQSLSNGTLSLCPMGNTYTNHRPRRPDRETAHRGHSASPPIQSNNNSNNNNIRRTRTAVVKKSASTPTDAPTDARDSLFQGCGNVFMGGSVCDSSECRNSNLPAAKGLLTPVHHGVT